MSPLQISVDFPAIFLANAPQFFHSNILQDGILSGKISLSETLQHPSIAGDVQLINGKLSGGSDSFSNLTEASGRISFDANRASLEFLNVASKEADLALRGEIDFKDINDVLGQHNRSDTGVRSHLASGRLREQNGDRASGATTCSCRDRVGISRRSFSTGLECQLERRDEWPVFD